MLNYNSCKFILKESREIMKSTLELLIKVDNFRLEQVQAGLSFESDTRHMDAMWIDNVLWPNLPLTEIRNGPELTFYSSVQLLKQ